MCSMRLICQAGQRLLTNPVNSSTANTNLQIVRHQTKHYLQKWRKMRGEKYMKVDLPDYQTKTEDLPPHKLRQKLKEQGMHPMRPWLERTFHISCTGVLIEPYVPPEGDGKMSIMSTGGAKQNVERIEKKTKSMLAVRKIRSFDEEFKTKEFAKEAHDIYVAAHTYLAEQDKYKLREYVTEHCYPEIRSNALNKTIRWKFLNSLEPPRVVYARCTEVFSKDNIFSQVTVRFHTQQQLAVYDRFGRLMHGSEILAKDVLEYVVFEKHLSNVYGKWRLHSKIIPDWMPPREPTRKTLVKEDVVEKEKEPDSKLLEISKLREPLKENEPAKVEQ